MFIKRETGILVPPSFLEYGFEKHIKVSFDQRGSFIERLQSHGLRNSFHKTVSMLPQSIQEVIDSIVPSPTTLCPKHKTFASLCPLATVAVYAS